MKITRKLYPTNQLLVAKRRPTPLSLTPNEQESFLPFPKLHLGNQRGNPSISSTPPSPPLLSHPLPSSMSRTHEMAKLANLHSFTSTDEVAAKLRQYVLQCQTHAFSRHNTFKIAVSGGSLPATLSKGLLMQSSASDENNTLDFSRWEIFFADERAVPLDHEDSNYGLLKKDLLDKIPAGQGTPKVHAIDVSVLEDTQEIADRYQESLMSSFANKDSVKLPQFDLVLLGCGPDGHTCSLFPGHELLRESDAWVAPIGDSPKPPPRRITLTLPVVLHATKIAFVATGGGKKDILKKIFESEEGRSLPCGLVNNGGGDKVSWFCDEAATQGITYPRRGSL